MKRRDNKSTLMIDQNIISTGVHHCIAILHDAFSILPRLHF